jgi:hypothetical protein
MRSLEKITKWLEERGAYYDITQDAVRAKVLLKEGERLVRVVRGPKGNLIGRVRGDSRIVVFPEVFDWLEEGQILACRLVERERYIIAIPLALQNDPKAGINIFWIERP